MPSALARLLLSFLPGRVIPSLLGVSHTARRLCACLHELSLLSGCGQLSDASPLSNLILLTNLDLDWCAELDDVRFVSSLVRLRALNLMDCSGQLVDVSPLALLTSLNTLHLGCSFFQPADGRVTPLVSRGAGNLALGWM